MKKHFLIFTLLYYISVQGQQTPIYSWQEHLSYQNAKLILEASDNIYCATDHGLYRYNKNDYLITRLNKINGLSDIEINAMGHDEKNNIIILAYKNSNLDLIKDESIINIPDIKLKEMFGIKKINNITIRDGIAYLSCSFGLVLLDLINEEIIDTYVLQDNGNVLEINDCAILEMSSTALKILAATSKGLYIGDDFSILNDPNNWTRNGSEMNAINIIRNENIGATLYKNENSAFLDIFYPDSVWMQEDGLKKIIYSNNILHKIHQNVVYLTNNGYDIIDSLENEQMINVNYSISDLENIIWIADSVNSLLKKEHDNHYSIIKPNGPASNVIRKTNFENQKLTILHNTENNSISTSSDLIDWTTLDLIPNVTCSKSNGNNTYYGSSTNGLSKIDENGNLTNYNLQNTNNILSENANVVGLALDQFGNVWGTKSNSSHPLFCKSSNENWSSFNMPFVANVSTEIGEIIIDNFGQKWGILKNNGLFVYQDNNTISDFSDDQFIKITDAAGQGNLSNKEVYSIVNDFDGNIWVGTKSGICVFYSPSLVFSGYDFDAQQIIIQDGDFGQYLLESEAIYSIKIDGGNRKWIGTLGSGIYLLSEDGTEEIYHFTKENSPLISNTILDIEINHKTAEVYITTDKGLISFRNDATFPESNQSNIKVFPNPVRHNYTGYISITGLMYNANVKITNTSGDLVFETYANGGMATWNGKDKNGKRASTGVYLVFCSSENRKEKAVAKILFIR